MERVKITFANAMNDFYQLEARTTSGKLLSFSTLKGKKVLIVNTASECGYTPQYANLQVLYEKFSSDLVVIAFPCNQFGGQEPGTDNQISAFCELNYGVTFPLMAKVNVKGPDQHPVFAWLCRKDLNGVADVEIKWNFQKFAVNEDGVLAAVFPHTMEPLDADILDWIRNPRLL